MWAYSSFCTKKSVPLVLAFQGLNCFLNCLLITQAKTTELVLVLIVMVQCQGHEVTCWGTVGLDFSYGCIHNLCNLFFMSGVKEVDLGGVGTMVQMEPDRTLNPYGLLPPPWRICGQTQLPTLEDKECGEGRD